MDEDNLKQIEVGTVRGLQDIHLGLFEGIEGYHAGQIRTVNIS